MVRIKNIPFIPKKKKRRSVASEPGLELVSAVYSINDALVVLTFNRSIDISAIDVAEFVVWDGVYAGQKLMGDSSSAIGADSVQINLVQVETFASSSCLMDVSAANGIEDASTGASWGGVTGYVLEIG